MSSMLRESTALFTTASFPGRRADYHQMNAGWSCGFWTTDSCVRHGGYWRKRSTRSQPREKSGNAHDAENSLSRSSKRAGSAARYVVPIRKIPAISKHLHAAFQHVSNQPSRTASSGSSWVSWLLRRGICCDRLLVPGRSLLKNQFLSYSVSLGGNNRPVRKPAYRTGLAAIDFRRPLESGVAEIGGKIPIEM